MTVFAQLFYSSDIWPSHHVRNGNVSSYCGTNDSLVFGLNSIYNTRDPSINSRSLLTKIFNLTSNSSNETTQITTSHTNIFNLTSDSSREPMQMTTQQSPVVTDVISTNSGPTTLPDQPCDAKCLEEIETDAIQVVRKMNYVNENKSLFVLIIGEGIRNFEQNINIPGI